MKIPRIIHQVHTLGMDKFRPDILNTIARNKDINPGWEHRFYDYNGMVAFIKEHYEARYLKAFLRINPHYGAAQADFFRYLVMNKVGGVYLDVKSYCIKPLDEIIREDDEFVVFEWNGHPQGKYENHGAHAEIARPGGEYQQWNIISTPGNKYIDAVVKDVLSNIENYHYSRQGVGWKGVIVTTGPIVYTNAIESVNDGIGIRLAGNHEANGIVYMDETIRRVKGTHYSQRFSYIVDSGLGHNILSYIHGSPSLILIWYRRAVGIKRKILSLRASGLSR